MTPPIGHEPDAFALGDTVTDGAWIGVVVVDIDAETASPPYVASEWTYLQRGVMVETREAGLVHYQDRKDLRRT